MSILAGTIRKGAEELVPFFSDKVIGLSVAYRLLGDLQRELLAEAYKRDPAYVCPTATVTLNATPTTTEFPLQEHTHLVDVTAVYATGVREPVTVLPYGYAGVLPSRFGCYEINRGLRLLGADQDWAGVLTLDYRYGNGSTASLTPTSETSTLLLPEVAHTALVTGLALLYADRMLLSGTLGDQDVANIFTRLEQRADTARTRWLDQVARVGQPRIMPTVDAFP